MKMNCLFCKIRDNQIPSAKIFENEKAFVILDINPMNYGHVLVISKNHYKDVLEIPSSDTAEIFSAVQIVSTALVDSYNLEGFNVITNRGEIAGQSIFHFHFHIIPRFTNDGLHFVRSLKTYPEGKLHETAERIKLHLKNKL